ncbi:integral membrane protein [Botrytis cinerea]
MSNDTQSQIDSTASALTYQTAHYNEDRGGLIVAICILNLTVIVTTVVVRLYAQNTIGKIRSLDSWLICIAAIIAIGVNICELVAKQNGLGKHFLRVMTEDSHPPNNYVTVFKMGYAMYLQQTLALMITKLSILAFYHRIFTVRHVTFKWSIYVTSLVSLCAGIATFIVFVFQCIPVELFWNRIYESLPPPYPVSLEGHCMSATIHVVVPLFFDLGTEIVILVLPVIGVWKLKLPMNKKLGLLTAFSLGIFVTAISIVRLVYTFPLAQGPDMSWDDIDVFLWTAIQCSFSIASACVPTMAPLYRVLSAKSKSSSYGNLEPSNSRRRTAQRSAPLESYGDTWIEDFDRDEGNESKDQFVNAHEVMCSSDVVSKSCGRGCESSVAGPQIEMKKISVRKDITIQRSSMV